MKQDQITSSVVSVSELRVRAARLRRIAAEFFTDAQLSRSALELAEEYEVAAEAKLDTTNESPADAVAPTTPGFDRSPSGNA